MIKAKDRNIADRVWDVFSSVKLAIIIFSLIALTSVVGTLLEQQASPAKNIPIITKFVGETLAPSVYNILEAMGFMDMYRSWWFVSLLVLFAVNLFICTLNRFPAIWKLVKEPVKPLKDEHLEAIPLRKEFTLKGKPEKVKEAVLKSAGVKFSESKTPGGYQLYWERGRFTRLGIFITHMSILVILGGAIIGIFFGFKGMVNIPEGESYAFAFIRTGPLTQQEIEERRRILGALVATGGSVSTAAGKLGVAEPHLQRRMKRLGIKPLGFSVRCDDFEMSFYGNSDMPKDYRSHLTVIDGGREVRRKWIEVNSPLRYKGITFYQSSYGIMPSSAAPVFSLRAASRDGITEALNLHQGDKFLIPATDVEVSVSDWSPALSFDQSGRSGTYTDMMNNPAIKLEINEGGREYIKWIMKRYPDTWVLTSGHIVELVDIWGVQYTGLQVRQDPGVWIVYFGCATMSLGLFVAFFMSHRRIWVRLSGEKGSTRVLVAATANKNREALERKIDRMVSLLREGGK